MVVAYIKTGFFASEFCAVVMGFNVNLKAFYGVYYWTQVYELVVNGVGGRMGILVVMTRRSCG